MSRLSLEFGTAKLPRVGSSGLRRSPSGVFRRGRLGRDRRRGDWNTSDNVDSEHAMLPRSDNVTRTPMNRYPADRARSVGECQPIHGKCMSEHSPVQKCTTEESASIVSQRKKRKRRARLSRTWKRLFGEVKVAELVVGGWPLPPFAGGSRWTGFADETDGSNSRADDLSRRWITLGSMAVEERLGHWLTRSQCHPKSWKVLYSSSETTGAGAGAASLAASSLAASSSMNATGAASPSRRLVRLRIRV
ncbi:hypothetical protein Pan216_10200 [Planctomycetes bacterium Pan216]|uniref:Uncharacterized protein n=1 Tax=Kolteria novifilia TaxID=2527975 RepID=A0A518AZP6_9BACT|nr:hypothetical protein Pan216_10200 [Planctomycetes bacterium Pan216]